MGLFFLVCFIKLTQNLIKENYIPHIEDLDFLNMSDVEVDDAPPVAAAAVTVVAAPMDIQKAIQEVLKESLIHDGLARGLRRPPKPLTRDRPSLASSRKTATRRT